ncbi:hypothetical protein OS190_04865 [Sulfitobacter sp. F26204]|uniref:hypothetical protein n=1 Tax=Sulfitobacter sp. F26204 TaxID=2996014 RepID=UPI00225E438E|nr:hypothetical protein [Sulfitobacter sp. F26204]MCX7558889.1 hypothetical protein [Sulfitobacter sp. F26204]
MMESKDIAEKIAAVQELLTLKFGIKLQPLDKMLKRAGRRLPRRMQAKAKVLTGAQQSAGNPRLVRQMDGTVVDQAFVELSTYLKGIDVADRRRGRLLGLAGILVFNLLFVIGAFVLWMWWRGYV